MYILVGLTCALVIAYISGHRVVTYHIFHLPPFGLPLWLRGPLSWYNLRVVLTTNLSKQVRASLVIVCTSNAEASSDNPSISQCTEDRSHPCRTLLPHLYNVWRSIFASCRIRCNTSSPVDSWRRSLRHPQGCTIHSWTHSCPPSMTRVIIKHSYTTWASGLSLLILIGDLEPMEWRRTFCQAHWVDMWLLDHWGDKGMILCSISKYKVVTLIS